MKEGVEMESLDWIDSDIGTQWVLDETKKWQYKEKR